MSEPEHFAAGHFPEGHFPAGHFPEASEETATLSVGLSALSEPSGVREYTRRPDDTESIIAEDAMLVEFVAKFLQSIESKAA